MKYKIFLVIFFFITLGYFSFAESVVVVKVIDGDTVILKDGRRVRLIGVDTPESSDIRKPNQYYSKEATEFLKKFIENKQVELEYGKEKKDKYNRTLGYFYLRINGKMIFVNKEIISQGYGFAYIKYPFEYMKEFLEAERAAKKNKKGLWKDGGKSELIWIIKNNQNSFEIFYMSNNLWGLKYKNFCFPRKSLKDIIKEIDAIKYFVNMYIDRDLWIELKKRKWKKI